MRKVGIAVLLVYAATCSGLDNFDVTLGGQAVIAGRTLVDELLGPVDFAGLGSVDITESKEYQNEGVEEDDVDSVRVVSFQLAIVSPQSGTFDFIESISIYAETKGLPRVRIASLEKIPSGAMQLSLAVDSVDLKPYVVATSMIVTAEASGQQPEDETTVDATVVLDVDVNVSGACSMTR
jgi:hypothetical protein